MIVRTLKILFVLLLTTLVSNAQISTKEVSDLLEKYKIKHKEIVLRQAIHETGNFKSRKCIQDKNLFGFETGKKVFKTYDDSVKAYKNRIQNRLKDNENYYLFLLRIKYATDKKYIYKLKNIKL
jgi:flagellum-specific peptidoglycan hydrolase FlgJ